MSEKKTGRANPLETAKQITETLANIPAETSFSFMLDENGHQAAVEALPVLEENYPSNYTNMRETVLAFFETAAAREPRTPLNVNLDEDERKAFMYASEVLERAIE
jgi:hypothetical protein